MKTLILIRHAKSSWDYELPDQERPLNARGEQASANMGAYLARSKYDLREIHTSPAKRAKTTARTIATYFPRSIITEAEDLYTFSNAHDPIRGYISSLNTDSPSVTIVGHNECLRDLVLQLSQGQIMEFPTCAVAIFGFEIDNWDELSRYDYPQLLEYITPKGIA